MDNSIKVVVYVLASSFVIFLKDVFGIGDGLYIIAGLFFWRAVVALGRAKAEEQQ